MCSLTKECVRLTGCHELLERKPTRGLVALAEMESYQSLGSEQRCIEVGRGLRIHTRDAVRRKDGHGGKVLSEAERLQDFPRAGPDTDACADFCKFVGRFIDVDGDSWCSAKCSREDEAPYAASTLRTDEASVSTCTV